MEEDVDIELWNGVLYLKQQSSADRFKEDTSVDKKCFELLVSMLKNCTIYNHGSEEKPDWWIVSGHPHVVRENELLFARQLGILNPKFKSEKGIINDAVRKIDRLRGQIYRNFSLEEPIIGYEEGGYICCLSKFNSKYFLELRHAVEVIDSTSDPTIVGGRLPPLAFPVLVVIALDRIQPENRPRTSFSLRTPSVDRHETYVVPSETWKNRAGDWILFDDVAPPNICIVTYEKKNEHFLIEAVSRELDKNVQAFLDVLKKVAKNHVRIEVRKQIIEPVGNTAKEIKQFLLDQTNIDSGITSGVARMLNDRCEYLGHDRKEKAREVIASKGWKHETTSQWEMPVTVNPFVRMAYRECFSEEEKIHHESAGLSELGEIMKLGTIPPQGYEKCIALPYNVTYDPRFPFTAKEQVKVRIEKDSLIIEKKQV